MGHLYPLSMTVLTIADWSDRRKSHLYRYWKMALILLACAWWYFCVPFVSPYFYIHRITASHGVLEWVARISYDQPLENPRIQFKTLSTGFFCSLSWAVIAQKEIRSPHSQMTYSDPIVWSSPFAAESMTGLFDIVRLQLGQVIWFSIFFPFLVTMKIEFNSW